jgi:hypothetical protein
VLLEMPAFKLLPPLEDAWNHSVAVSDLPDQAVVVSPDQRATGAAPLGKIFFEFTPLELDDWRDVEATQEDAHSFTRGAYLAREDDRFELWLAQQAFPSCQISVCGPYRFVFDRETRRIVIQGDRGTAPLSTVPLAGKTLLTMLTLLRDLSSEPLASPFLELLTHEGVASFRIQGNGTVALLGVGDTYVMRDLRRQASFAGTNTSLRVDVLNGAAWEAFGPDQVRRAVAAQVTP